MSRETSRQVWVTGASSGLGRALAEAFFRRGDHVVASARNEEALKALEDLNPRLTAISCDITDCKAMNETAVKLSKINSTFDLVILNAGNCEYLDFPNPDWDAIQRVMQVNYFGTINCLKAVLPLMVGSKEKHSHLVVIASQVTMAPFPRAEAYGASKAAIQYFFSCLRMDLAEQFIDVTIVHPGFVDTPLTKKNDFPMPFLMDTETAAARILSTLESRPREFSFPRRLRLFLWISSLLPGLWQKMVSKR